MGFLLLLDALIWLDDFDEVQMVVAKIAPLRRHPRTWPLRLHSGRVLRRLEAQRKKPSHTTEPEHMHGLRDPTTSRASPGKGEPR